MKLSPVRSPSLHVRPALSDLPARLRPAHAWLSAAALLAALLAAVSTTAQTPQIGPPPAAPSQPVSTLLHGVSVADPFRNLENLRDPKTRSWLDAQSKWASTYLAGIPGRSVLAARVAELSTQSGDRVSGVQLLAGGQVVYLKRAIGEKQFRLVMRERLDGPERVLVDPQAVSNAPNSRTSAKPTTAPRAINYFQASWDGRYVAYGISEGGSEEASLRVLDVRRGEVVAGPVPRVMEPHLSWTPDSQRVCFNQLRELPKNAPDTETYLDSKVQCLSAMHWLTSGTPFVRSRKAGIFGRTTSPALKLDRLDVGQVTFHPTSQHMVVRTTDTTVPEGKLFVAPVTSIAKPREIPWTLIATPRDQVKRIELRGDTLFLLTTHQAPMGRVLALDLREGNQALSKAREVVPQGRLPIEDLSVNADGSEVWVNVRQGFTVRTHVWRNGLLQDLLPDLSGSVYASQGLGVSPRAVVFNASWTAPSQLRVREANGQLLDTPLETLRLPPNLPEVEAREVRVPGLDGVAIPLTVLHRKGLVLDGKAPTLLEGYGSYGMSISAGFDPRRAAWLERGGVVALVNPRGSGAYGEPWHRAGFKATKPNTWKDGIAAAQWLISQGYTSPQQLAVKGTSAGGIFVGRTVTDAPQLFAAAVMDVGVMDAVRAEFSANGITNVSEFGSAKDPKELPWVLAMSTYHAIKDGVAYPAILFLHGLNDPRVDVWHSAKTAARFQQVAAGPGGSGKPVVLRLDAQAGHGMGSNALQRADMLTDEYAFLLSTMGYAERIGDPSKAN